MQSPVFCTPKNETFNVFFKEKVKAQISEVKGNKSVPEKQEKKSEIRYGKLKETSLYLNSRPGTGNGISS